MSEFPALTGFYKLLFLYFEPIAAIIPAPITWFFPAWFHHDLIPTVLTVPAGGALDPRTTMAIWQLGNCYLLLGLISSLVFRAVRDALPNNPVAQEKIVGASLTALALADISHIIATLIGLPSEIRYDPSMWNSLTHGNITFVIFLLSVRLAWFMGVGRTTYYYGQPKVTKKRT